MLSDLNCLPEIMSFTITLPDRANRFILQLAEMKRSTKHLHFMALVIRIWNYISIKISVDVSYASFKHSSKLFIKNNPIPYRVTLLLVTP